jgi:glycogen debranching enzyme
MSACVGSVSEIFDGERPYTPRGCCAQAWSVAELLRLMTTLSQAELDAVRGPEDGSQTRR